MRCSVAKRSVRLHVVDGARLDDGERRTGGELARLVGAQRLQRLRIGDARRRRAARAARRARSRRRVPPGLSVVMRSRLPGCVRAVPMSDFRWSMSDGGCEGGVMEMSFDTQYAALSSRDARFDGQFIAGVHHDRHLLPPQLPGHHPEARQRALLPHRRGRPRRRPARLQALPARCRARLPRLEPARRPRLARHAARAGRRRRARGRRRPRPPPRLHAAPRLAACCRPSSAPDRSRSPARTAPRPRGRCSPPPTSRSPTSRTRPGSAACASSTTPSPPSTGRRRPSCARSPAGVARVGRSASGRQDAADGGELTLRLPARAPFDSRRPLPLLRRPRHRGYRGAATTRAIERSADASRRTRRDRRSRPTSSAPA